MKDAEFFLLKTMVYELSLEECLQFVICKF